VESVYPESLPAAVWSLAIPGEQCRVLELSPVEWGLGYLDYRLGLAVEDFQLVEVAEWEAHP